MTGERRAAVYVGLIFVSGLLLGGTLMNLAEHFWLHPRTDAEYDLRQHAKVAAQMAAQLNLSEQQTAAVDRVLQQVVLNYEQLEQQLAPQFDAIRQQGRDHVRALLTESQRHAYDQLVQRVDMHYPAGTMPAAVPDPCGVLAAPLNSH